MIRGLRVMRADGPMPVRPSSAPGPGAKDVLRPGGPDGMSKECPMTRRSTIFLLGAAVAAVLAPARPAAAVLVGDLVRARAPATPER